MTVLIIIAACAVTLALWVTLVRVVFALPDRPTLRWATTRDGWKLSLWHRVPRQQRFVEPVVLCHGLGNNNAFFEFRGRSHLARVLADAGFEVFTIDCRGAGRSIAPAPEFAQATIDDHVESDVPAVLEVIRAVTGQERVLWVGHSLGGIIGVLAAARQAKGRFAARVTIGSPFFFHANVFFARALALGRLLAPAGRFPARVLATMAAPFAGWFPTPSHVRLSANLDNLDGADQRALMANVFADLWKGVLLQLSRWVANDALTSTEGVDWRTPALLVDEPTLVIGGSVDGLAPLHVTQRFFEALSVTDKELLLVGKDHGTAVDYGHGDLVLGRNASVDVYPAIVEFLQRHARPSVAAAEGQTRQPGQGGSLVDRLDVHP